jgi:hypothetical protein
MLKLDNNSLKVNPLDFPNYGREWDLLIFPPPKPPPFRQGVLKMGPKKGGSISKTVITEWTLGKGRQTGLRNI